MSSSPPSPKMSSQSEHQDHVSDQVEAQADKQEQDQPATPPLSPHVDNNFTSPSPLLIRDDGKRNAQSVPQSECQISETIRDNENDDNDRKNLAPASSSSSSPSTYPSNQPDIPIPSSSKTNQERAQERSKSVEKDLRVFHLSTALGTDDIGTNAIAADLEYEEDVNEHEGEDQNRDKQKGKVVFPPRSSSLYAKGTPPRPLSNLVVGSDFPSTNTNTNAVNDSSAGSTAGNAKASPNVISDSKGTGSGNAGLGRYISPSDALISPCTQKLAALKMKKIERGSVAANANAKRSTNDSEGDSTAGGIAKRLFVGRFGFAGAKKQDGDDGDAGKKV